MVKSLEIFFESYNKCFTPVRLQRIVEKVVLQFF